MSPGSEPERKTMLVVGADGTIGRALAAHLESCGHRVWKTTRRSGVAHDQTVHLDLAADPSGWRLPTDVSTAFFCAGQASTHYCRLHPEESRAVNVEGTVALAKLMKEAGTRVIFLSTDLVFDGEVAHRAAHDKTCPRTEYGRQKAVAEEELLALGERTVIVRLAKVIGPDNELLKSWQITLRAKDPIHPLSDKVCAPVPLGFVVEALTRLSGSPYSGIVQISASQDVTYEEMARQLAQQLGAPMELVQPVVSNGGEPPPRHSALDTSKLQEVLKMTPPEPWACLDALV